VNTSVGKSERVKREYCLEAVMGGECDKWFKKTWAPNLRFVGGLFEKFVDWRQCAAVMQREAMIVMPSYSSGSNVVVA
jgi:hypothetical protein